LTGRWDAFLRQTGAICISALLALHALPAHALTADLSAPGAPEDVVDRLRGASSILAAEENGLDTPQEILAASLADYRTLVQVLYDAGFFGPDISIRLNGREAANIPLIEPPSSIDRVEIRVNTGPLFRFGTARAATLAP